jgi:hypothetical protein
VQVNHRFFGPLDADGFDALTDDLRSGRLADTVPAHGILSRVERSVGLPARAARSAPGAEADPKSGSATGPAAGAAPE